jgi:hypothetical protein
MLGVVDDHGKVSRGSFLKICGQILGAGLLGSPVDARSLLTVAGGPFTAEEAAARRGRFRLQDATAPLFRQYLNTSFAVRAADGILARLVLVKVIERPVTKHVEQFSLTFHAPAATTVRDGMHAFRHPSLGDFTMFIVPVGAPNPRRSVYQACFSRHPSPREVRHGEAAQSGLPPGWRT